MWKPTAIYIGFPPEIKANKESFPLTLIGYTKEQMMVLTQLVGDEDIDLLIIKIFEERPDIEYLHARNAEACCLFIKLKEFNTQYYFVLGCLHSSQ
jgi:hypothetical protein